MLMKFRSKAAYLTIRLLFVVLIGAFGAWGIGDVFRLGTGQNVVATIGPVKIAGEDFLREYRTEVKRMEAVFGSALEPEALRQLGIPERVLDQMITRVVFEIAVGRLDMAVSDEVVRRAIETDKTFFNNLGQFDRNRFQALLYQGNLSEEGYVALLRQDISRQQMLTAVAAGSLAPTTLVQSIHRFRGERRIADTILISTDSTALPAVPDETTLAAFHEEHAERYQSPEYRSLTVARLSPDDIVAEMTVSEDELRAEMDSRQGEFDTPERRELEQIVLGDEASARAAASRLAAGAAFEDVAREATGAAPVPLGAVDRNEIASVVPELADPAFATPEGQSSAPVESKLGWHILKVVKIEPAIRPGVAEIRDKIALDLKQQRAVDSMIGIANQFDDALAGGSALETAAQALSLKVDKVAAVDAAGKTPDGMDVMGLAGSPTVLRLVASLGAGETSQLTETPEGGYIALSVDAISPPAPRPLAELRDRVIADWQAAERDKAAGAAAAAAAAEVDGGADLAAVAARLGVAVKTSEPFARGAGDPGAGIDAALAAELFEAATGKAVAGTAEGGHVVAVLKEIRPAAPGDAGGVADIEKGIKEGIAVDLLAQFSAALRQQIEISIDRSVLDGLI